MQLFVTSHSSNFASNSNLDCLTCLVESDNRVEAFFPRDIRFEKGKREKLERYLDVTRAELFFARRVVFVEGAAELMLVDALATLAGFDLRSHGVSLISVEGLNFDSFLPLFGEKSLNIPVALITDADPQPQVVEGEEDEEEDEEDKVKAVYPALGENVVVSRNTAKVKALEDYYVKIFHGVKTLEYDLALYENNREAMLTALAELHPQIAKSLRRVVDAQADNTCKARELFRGMFERSHNNVQKGSFGQALAQVIRKGIDFEVPGYIRSAFEHVCQVEKH
ncbi:ATP-dependent nuclease [Chromohalobacter israelensis]|uniref:ATP-dependent nuclease n=1 Tax=Chromohalobacter israelensis TaxID=141390 RepID=UPI003D7BF8CD